MNRINFSLKFSIIALLVPIIIFGQGKKKKEAYEFTILHQVETTPVKNQSRTGTCWSFAATSFIETELIRMGKGEHILSPMWFVRFAYPDKAEKYIRYHGSYNFSVGGQAHDVTNIVKRFGFVPEEFYKGMNIGEEEHNHGEMASVLEGIVDGVKKNRGGKITPVWKNVFEAALNIYLGKPPEEFVYQGKTYTPKNFADSLGFNADDYVDNEYFITKERWESYQRAIKREEERKKAEKHGTVGAVALDKEGNIAAGTSTGGMMMKKFGRVGDAPIIGAGTYANNNTCGVSATGSGEYFIRIGVAKDISSLIEYKGMSIKDASEEVIKKVGNLGGSGGVICLDKFGNVAMPFNTEGMYRGFYLSGGQPVVKMYKGN